MYRKEAVSEAETFKVVVINGGDNQQTPDTPAQLAAGKDLEGNLDAETIIGIDYPTPLTAFTTGGMPPFDPDDLTRRSPYSLDPGLLLMRHSNGHQRTLPAVSQRRSGYDHHSPSHQLVPTVTTSKLSLNHTLKKVCNLFAQLGARGTSFLCASGDNGVGATGDCFTNDGKNTSTFLPSFPDGCPYVTSVGATKNVNPEVAAYDPRNGFASGGGFSNYFPRPSYQDDNKVVKNYISSLGGEFAGLFNTTGRAYPDISAQGQSFITIWNGSIVLLGRDQCVDAYCFCGAVLG